MMFSCFAKGERRAREAPGHCDRPKKNKKNCCPPTACWLPFPKIGKESLGTLPAAARNKLYGAHDVGNATWRGPYLITLLCGKV
jgi:hypothetical protein